MSETTDCSAPLHPLLEPLSWLLGKWSAEDGRAFFPTMAEMKYGEQMEFFHVGQPNIQFRSNSWVAGTKKPLHFESGFIRVQPGTSHIALICAQNLGVCEVEEGEVNGQEIKLESRALGRMSFGKEPAVTKVARHWRRVGDQLETTTSMATTATELQEHLKITYTKIA